VTQCTYVSGRSKISGRSSGSRLRSGSRQTTVARTVAGGGRDFAQTARLRPTLGVPRMYTSAHACNEAGAIPFGLISTNSPPCPPNFDDFQAAARRMNQQVVLPNLDVFDGFDLRRKRPAPHDLNAYSSASSDDLSAYFSAYYHESETMWGESGKRPTSFTETLISAWVQLLEMMLVLHRRLCRMKSSEC
jgi:hypothetical protein